MSPGGGDVPLPGDARRLAATVVAEVVIARDAGDRPSETRSRPSMVATDAQ